MAEIDPDQPPAGRFVAREHRFPVRVYFEDTDLSGVAYHANYLRWMERARSDMLRLLGVDQRAAHEAGEGAYAVTDIAIRYAASARLDDDLIVTSKLIEVSAVRVVIHQTVRCGTVKLTDARVTVAWVGPNGRPRRQPADWIAIYQRLVWQGDTEHP